MDELAQPAPPEPAARIKRHWLRTTFFIVCIVVLLIAGTYRVWLPRALAIYGLYELRNIAGLDNRPEFKQLDTSISATHTFQFGMVDVDVPWSDVPIRRGSTTQALIFGTTTGKRVIGIFPGVEFKSLVDTPDAAKLFGNTLHTNYDVYRAEEYTTRSDIHLFASPKEFLPRSLLLTLKAVTALNSPSYEFMNAHSVRGFEYVRSATSTVIELFLPDDTNYNMLITGASSAETDAILASLRMSTSTSK